MLPVLFFEITWKAVWLLRVALPATIAGTMDEVMSEMVVMLSVVGLVFLVVPWDYVIARFLREPGDRWWGRRRAAASSTK
jgi:hypothetical protein